MRTLSQYGSTLSAATQDVETPRSPKKSELKKKAIQKQRQGQYNLISNSLRLKIIFDIEVLKKPVRQVCEEYNVNYFSAKNVLALYSKEGRIEKLHNSCSSSEPFLLPVPKVNEESNKVSSQTLSTKHEISFPSFQECRIKLELHMGLAKKGESSGLYLESNGEMERLVNSVTGTPSP